MEVLPVIALLPCAARNALIAPTRLPPSPDSAHGALDGHVVVTTGVLEVLLDELIGFGDVECGVGVGDVVGAELKPGRLP